MEHIDKEHDAEEIARLGEEIYKREIHAEEFEAEHEGEFLVVDVTTGEYALASDDAEAFDLAEEKNPDAVLYLLRVGHRTAHRIGLAVRPATHASR